MDVLIVDDEEDLCILLGSICHSRDFTATCVNTLKNGLEEIDSFPMLMFLDNNLPDGLGLEMIEQFKTRSPLTKIAFITGCPDERIMNEAFSKGIDYFLAKPFQLHGIREILSQFHKRLAEPLVEQATHKLAPVFRSRMA
jgi:two-component system, OmpR family, response regulator